MSNILRYPASGAVHFVEVRDEKGNERRFIVRTSIERGMLKSSCRAAGLRVLNTGVQAVQTAAEVAQELGIPLKP